MLTYSSDNLLKSNKIESVCEECGNTDLRHDNITGEIICSRCGVVFSEVWLNSEPVFSQVNNGNRVGTSLSFMNFMIPDKGLSTNIDVSGKDHAGKTLDKDTRMRIFRLKKWNRRSKLHDSKKRNLSIALSIMNRINSSLNLPRNVLESGALIYRKALNENLTKGKKIIELVSASLYIACRQCNVLRTLTEFAECTGITRKTLAKNYRFLNNSLGITIPNYRKTDYINTLTSKMGLLSPVEKVALKILDEANKNNLSLGCNPSGIAAACVYISSKLHNLMITQEEVSKNAMVTEVTIRNRYKALLKNLTVEIYL